MPRLIDADEIRKKAVPHTRGDFGGYNSNIRKWAVLVGDIDNAPTVDAVEVVHGRWKLCGANFYQNFYNCSVCGASYDGRPNYCPNCGAKMDGDGNG